MFYRGFLRNGGTGYSHIIQKFTISLSKSMVLLIPQFPKPPKWSICKWGFSQFLPFSHLAILFLFWMCRNKIRRWSAAAFPLPFGEGLRRSLGTVGRGPKPRCPEVNSYGISRWVGGFSMRNLCEIPWESLMEILDIRIFGYLIVTWN